MFSHRSRMIAVFLATLALAAGCGTADQDSRYRTFFLQQAEMLVPGFRLPDDSEYGPLWAVIEGQGWQTRDGSGAAKAGIWTSGELNGDTTKDYVYILVNEATGAKTLFAFVSTVAGYKAMQLDAGFEWGAWLRTVAPGRYATAASRGAGSDSPNSILEFEAEYQAVDFFQFEGGASTFAWNDFTSSFDRYLTSD